MYNNNQVFRLERHNNWKNNISCILGAKFQVIGCQKISDENCESMKKKSMTLKISMFIVKQR